MTGRPPISTLSPSPTLSRFKRKKPVQSRAGGGRAGQTTAAKGHRRHVKIATVLLDKQIGGSFRDSEERMLCAIDAHRFGNARLVIVAGFDFPPLWQLAQWEMVWSVAVDLVRRDKDKRRFWTKISCSLQQIECAVGVDGEVGLWIPARPVMRGLRGRVDHGRDTTSMLLE